MDKRTRIEFKPNFFYGSKGNIIINYEIVKTDVQSDQFAKWIGIIDKRLFAQWSDAITIFDLTERQLIKFKTLINKS